ncbi:MAG TPA: 2OG-Fe(II) oxygenase [Luteimonas sp.]|nr:2OG-Fe(II) oxygenase [Luteimonas sp.]
MLARRDALAGAFASAAPFPHVVVDGFFEPAFAQALLDGFPPFARADSLGEDGRPGAKGTFERIRALGEPYAALDDLVRSDAFLRFAGAVCGIEGLLYDPWYLGGGTHENRSGASLEPHVDFAFHPLERWRRRINVIVYLNHEWDPAWGGNLSLYADPRRDGTPAVSVAPLFNRCVMFETSDRSWHGFDRIATPPGRPDLTRRSIALYFYTRPDAGDRREAHSTVYVGRALPARLQAGHALDEADVAELRALLADRDGRIEMQYAEIARLMNALRAHERGATGFALYHARRLLARLRRRRG